MERAKTAGLPLEPFTVHGLRRTGSTLLNEVGFNGNWIEKCLAHEEVDTATLIPHMLEAFIVGDQGSRRKECSAAPSAKPSI